MLVWYDILVCVNDLVPEVIAPTVSPSGERLAPPGRGLVLRRDEATIRSRVVSSCRGAVRHARLHRWREAGGDDVSTRDVLV